MLKKKNLPKHLTVVLLIGLTAFLTNCKTLQIPSVEVEKALSALAPPVPQMPEMEPVAFEDKDEGLWLSYNNYRALERNVIALHEYISKLKTVVNFYRGEQ